MRFNRVDNTRRLVYSQFWGICSQKRSIKSNRSMFEFNLQKISLFGKVILASIELLVKESIKVCSSMEYFVKAQTHSKENGFLILSMVRRLKVRPYTPLEDSGSIEADDPDNAPSLFRLPNLDGRGPARFLRMDDLKGIVHRPIN